MPGSRWRGGGTGVTWRCLHDGNGCGAVARRKRNIFDTIFECKIQSEGRTDKIAFLALRIILKNFRTVSENFDNYCGEF